MKLIHLNHESSLENLASQLAACLPEAFTIYLQGDMGTGKTTLVRALLGQLGYQDKVVSPTYTLVEAYEIGQRWVVHLDLYRLIVPEEVINLGLERWGQALMLVEWPQQGQGFVPAADLTFYLDFGDADHQRLLRMVANSPAGQQWLAQNCNNFDD